MDKLVYEFVQGAVNIRNDINSVICAMFYVIRQCGAVKGVLLERSEAEFLQLDNSD